MRAHGSWLVAVVCLLVSAASADAATLRGRVEDQTGGAIQGARVRVACGPAGSTAVEATSDAAGAFAIRDLPDSRCVVTADHRHFASSTLRVALTAGADAAVRLVLPIETFEAHVLVTAAGGGRREPIDDVPASVSVVTGDTLDARPYRLLPQVLREEPGVLVQQTTAAQASPIIRGFTGQSNIYLVDGVRLNTAAWRSGPSQYLAWLTPGAIERVEVVRGPVSVQYGSDGLGGAVNVLVPRPAFSPAGRRIAGLVEGTFSSSDAGGGLDALLTYQTPAFALSGGAARVRAQDLRAGGGRDSHAAVTRFLGLPSRVVDTRLRETGFDQWSGHAALQARAGRDGILGAFYRRDEQSGVSRYDRIVGGEGLYRSEIAPQRLDFAVARYERAAVPAIGGLRATFSINRQQDGTLEQARPTARIDRERTSATVLGYQLQGTRCFAGDRVASVGAEVYDEWLDGRRLLETAGVETPARPSILDGTRYASSGLFAQAGTGALGGRVTLRGGLRWGHYVYRTVANAAFGAHPERVATDALTGHAAAVVSLSPAWKATLSASRGFRAANAFDLSAIGVSGGGGFEISPGRAAESGAIVGSSDGPDAVATARAVAPLGPESVYAFEAGLRVGAGRVTASATAFDLELMDLIQRRTLVFPQDMVGTTISGQEIVRQDTAGRAYIALDPRPIATRVNVDRARVAGVELDGQVRLARRWLARAYFSIADGHQLGTGVYLRRMPPPAGGVVLRWERARPGLRVEGTVAFARPQTRLSGGDLSDPRIGALRTRASIGNFFNGSAVDLGLVRNGILVPTGETLAEVQARVLGGASSAPLFSGGRGFLVFGARVAWPIRPNAELVVIGENLTDRNYRLHGSGVDAPGFNLQIRTRVRF